MEKAPEITASTPEERRAYIKERFPCIADCEMCGLCKVFHGKESYIVLIGTVLIFSSYPAPSF